MQRYFVAPEQIRGDEADITGDDARHLIRVLRAVPGDRLILCDGSGRECLAEIVALERERAALKVLEERTCENEPAVHIRIAQSLPKGDKFETVIQKGTEIGASAFLPFVSARTVVQYDARQEARRVDRWRKIAKEAAEQAHRGRVPLVSEPMRWSELLDAAAEAKLALLCYEKESASLLRDVLRAAGPLRRGDTVLIVVGPEGGFTDAEVAEARRRGIAPVGLGRRILRTETAALVAAACVFYETGEMGGA